MYIRDLGPWEFMFTFGLTLDIYGHGNLRIAIDRETGKQILGYIAKGGN